MAPERKTPKTETGRASKSTLHGGRGSGNSPSPSTLAKSICIKQTPQRKPSVLRPAPPSSPTKNTVSEGKHTIQRSPSLIFPHQLHGWFVPNPKAFLIQGSPIRRQMLPLANTFGCIEMAVMLMSSKDSIKNRPPAQNITCETQADASRVLDSTRCLLYTSPSPRDA